MRHPSRWGIDSEGRNTEKQGFGPAFFISETTVSAQPAPLRPFARILSKNAAALRSDNSDTTTPSDSNGLKNIRGRAAGDVADECPYLPGGHRAGRNIFAEGHYGKRGPTAAMYRASERSGANARKTKREATPHRTQRSPVSGSFRQMFGKSVRLRNGKSHTGRTSGPRSPNESRQRRLQKNVSPEAARRRSKDAPEQLPCENSRNGSRPEPSPERPAFRAGRITRSEDSRIRMPPGQFPGRNDGRRRTGGQIECAHRTGQNNRKRTFTKASSEKPLERPYATRTG